MIHCRGDVETFHELADDGWRLLKNHPEGRPGVVDLIPLDAKKYNALKKVIAVGSGAIWT